MSDSAIEKKISIDFQNVNLKVCSKSRCFTSCPVALDSFRDFGKIVQVLHVVVNHPLSPMIVIYWLGYGERIEGVLLVVDVLLLLPALLAGGDALVQPVLLLQRPVDETQIS